MATLKIVSDGKYINDAPSERTNRYHSALRREKLTEEWIFAGHRTHKNGKKKKSNERCGLYSKFYSCPDHLDEITVKQYNCGVIGCPVCFHGASSMKAEEPSLRLWTYAKNNNLNVYHVAMNYQFPESEVPTFSQVSKIRNKIVRQVKKHGIGQFILVFHMYRLRDYKDGQELYISPHFHMLCAGKFNIKSGCKCKKEGIVNCDCDTWVKRYDYTYRNLGIRNTCNSLRATLSYMLNHCVYSPHKASYNMYGLRKGLYRKQYKESKLCEECEKEICEIVDGIQVLGKPALPSEQSAFFEIGNSMHLIDMREFIHKPLGYSELDGIILKNPVIDETSPLMMKITKIYNKKWKWYTDSKIFDLPKKITKVKDKKKKRELIFKFENEYYGLQNVFCHTYHKTRDKDID